jgi:osmoprotectant transport system substrate-binding protein
MPAQPDARQTATNEEKMHMRRAKFRPLALLAVLALIAALVLAACGDDDDEQSSGGGEEKSQSTEQPGKGKPPVTLGTKDFTEEFVLGELYKQALEAKGYTVKLKKNIGATEIIDKALTSGEIDGYPEYLGVSVAVVARKDIVPKSDKQTYQLAKDFYEGRGQVITKQTPFFDVDAIATTKKFADENGLKTVADLKKLDSFTVGARPEFRNRFQGLKGMKSEYGLNNAQFKQLALGIQYQALDNDDVDSANVFSTDAQLASGKYLVLEDPKGIFGYQHVAMVMNKDKYEQLGGPAFGAVVDQVSALLTNKAMITMNKAVAIDKQDEAEVARSFLEANNLL